MTLFASNSAVETADQFFVLIERWVVAHVPGAAQPVVADVISVVALLAVFASLFAVTTVLERKGLGRIQNRYGPNRVGPFGILQPLADGIKSLTKEDVVPLAADRWVHYFAPLVLVAAAFSMYAVLPIIPAALVWLAAGREWPMWLAILLTLAIVLPISPLLYRICFQPIADASVLVLLIVAVAVHFALSGMALIFFGPEGFRTEPMTRAFFDLGPINISGQSLLIIGSSALFSILLFVVFERTLIGKALRATAVNRLGARLVGILPSTTGTIAFLLASALAGISGILIGPVTTLYYDSGFLIGLKAFVGAIIGGLVSYPATAVGAILVGLFESYAAFWNSGFKEVLVFSLLIPILIWQSLTTGTGVEEEIEEEDREGGG